MAALRLIGITKTFDGTVANENVSVEFARGTVHALLGENGAGKSTLMKIAFGLIRSDIGTIEVAGEEVSFRSPREALEHGIGMVQQHFTLVPNMTAVENIALVTTGGRLRRIKLHEVRTRLRELTERYGLDVPVETKVAELSVGVRQRIELLKLLYRGADVLILDEPTATLSPFEWDQLAPILREFADAGRTIVFVTHKLEEVFAVAQSCTVLRDGRVIDTLDVRDASPAELVRMMVGREISFKRRRPALTPGASVVEADGLTLAAEGAHRLDEISFFVREHEILGIAGVEGNGQQELFDVLTGNARPTAGRVSYSGVQLEALTPNAFSAAGGAAIPDDRHEKGLALDLSIEENLILNCSSLADVTYRGLVDRAAVHRRAEELIRSFDIRPRDPRAPAWKLSGGNQQKVVVARELSRLPTFLIAAQPTRGLDIGARDFVHEQLEAHKQRGGATLLISADLDEIFALADRIGVMVGGRLLRIVETDSTSTHEVGLMMAGGTAPETAS